MSATVRAKQAPLKRAMAASHLSLRGLERATERAVSRATVHNLLGVVGYSVNRDKAEAIAKALGEPVAALFVHHDGAPLGGEL